MFKKSKRRSTQNSSTSKLQNKSLVRIIFSLFIAIIAWVAATSFESYLLSDKNVETVVVAKKDIPKDTYIDDKNRETFFEYAVVNADFVSEVTIKDMKEINGKMTVSIKKNGILTTDFLINTAEANENFLKPVEVSFAIANANNGINGYIRKGDIVSLIVTSTDRQTGEKMSSLYKSDVYIIDALDSSYKIIDASDTTSQAVYFKIYIESEEAAEFNTILANDEISIVKQTQQ